MKPRPTLYFIFVEDWTTEIAQHRTASGIKFTDISYLISATDIFSIIGS